MNLEFLIAISFGFGISGLIHTARSTSKGRLAYRVIPITSSYRSVRKGSFISSWKLFINHSRSETSSRLERALFELPEIIDLLSVSLRAGEGIYRSFTNVVPRCEGELAKELTKVLKAVEFGAAFGTEIKTVADALPHPQVSEFVNKVSLALERGTPLAQMLKEQGNSVRDEIKSRLLRQAGRNETRMLIPLVFLILPVTVLFAIYPSLKLLNFGFI